MKRNRWFILAALLAGILVLSGCPSISTQTQAALSSLVISPADTTAKVGETVQFTVQGKGAGGESVTVSSLAWSVSNDAGTIEISGLFHASKVGACKVLVSANQGQFTAQANVVIQGEGPSTPTPTIPTPSVLASIEISPTSANLAVDDIQQFNAKGVDSKGQEMALAGAQWSVEGDIGTVDSNGLFTATKAGLGKVKIASASVQANATVKVKENQIFIPTPTTPEPTPTPTSETYTTQVFGFKLSYPADWSFDQNPDNMVAVLVSPDGQSKIYAYDGSTEEILNAQEIAYNLLSSWDIPNSDITSDGFFTARNGMSAYFVRFTQTLSGQPGEGVLYTYIKIAGSQTQCFWIDGDGRGEAGMMQITAVLDPMLKSNGLDIGSQEPSPTPTPTPTPTPQSNVHKGLNFDITYPAGWILRMGEGMTEYSSPDTRMYITVFEGVEDPSTTAQDEVQAMLDTFGVTESDILGDDTYTAKNGWDVYYLGFDETMNSRAWKAIAFAAVGDNQAGERSYIIFLAEGVEGASADEVVNILNGMLKAVKLSPQ